MRPGEVRDCSGEGTGLGELSCGLVSVWSTLVGGAVGCAGTGASRTPRAGSLPRCAAAGGALISKRSIRQAHVLPRRSCRRGGPREAECLGHRRAAIRPRPKNRNDESANTLRLCRSGGVFGLWS